jgi:hypothetical protein
MRTWMLLLGPLAVWSLHFFGLYLVAEFAPEAQMPALFVLTPSALAANFYWFRNAAVAGGFAIPVAMGACAISVIAIFWQALPLLLA